MGLFGLVAIAPVLLADYPGFAGYPNLLARVFVLSNLDRRELLSQYYQLHAKAVPNEAFELIGPLLIGAGVPLEHAGKIFVGLSILAFCGGTVFLAYAAQKRPPWLALGAFAFATNGYLILLNYIFALGLAFGALGLWLSKNRQTVWTALLFSFIPCLLLSCHLIAFGVYALAVGTFALYGWFTSPRRKEDRLKAARELLHFLPSLLLYALFFEHLGTMRVSYGNPLDAKLAGLYAMFSSPDGLGWDYLLITAAAAAAMLLWRSAGLTFASRMTAFASAAMLAAFMLAPASALGFWLVDSRLALPLLCFALTFVQVPRAASLAPQLAAGLIFGLFAVAAQRSAATIEHWRLISQTYAHVRQAMSGIKEGSRIATVVRQQGLHPQFAPEQSAACFAIIDHAAFVPDLDAFPLSQDSIAYKDAFAEEARRFRNLSVDASNPNLDWEQLAKAFDYVLFFTGGAPADAPAFLHPIARGKDFVLLSAATPPARLRIPRLRSGRPGLPFR